jgi:hypothetical protein
MIDVKKQKCLECDICPSYNFKGQTKSLYCNKHKKEGMVDVKSEMCIVCDIARALKKYDKMCAPCYFFSHPEKKPLARYLSKELTLREELKPFLLEQEFKCSFNKTLGACSKRRPDIFIECLTHVLIIECDENQHESYDEICNHKRMMEIFQDCASRPIIFIRFNPDNYTSNNKVIKSPFTKKQILWRKKIKNKIEWTNRLSILQDNC